jgi:hypothetical protein
VSRPAAPPEALAARFVAVRRATEALAAPLSPEDCGLQSMPEASPVKWHLAHSSWFFETFVLSPRASGYRPIDPQYAWLFNSYYESLAGGGPPRSERALLSRPSLAQIQASGATWTRPCSRSCRATRRRRRW